MEVVIMNYKDSYRDALDFTCKKLGLKYYKVPKRPTCVGIKYGYDIIYLIRRCCYIRYTIKSTKETKDIPTGTTASMPFSICLLITLYCLLITLSSVLYTFLCLTDIIMYDTIFL